MRHKYLCIAALIAVASAYAPRTYGGEAGEMLAVEPQSLKFGPVAGVPPCAQAAALRGDPSKGAAVLLIKIAAGCRIPWHWHTASEQLMVVSGAGTLEMREGKTLKLGPGAYASMPGHQVHQASCAKACLMFNASDGAFDIHYVDSAGKEISADEALKAKAQKKSK
jgi:quercetin dioxygenase-like cupin family protein